MISPVLYSSKILKKNFILINEGDSVFLINAYCQLVLKSLGSRMLCCWLSDQLDLKKTIADVLEEAPKHLKSTISALLEKLIENNLVCFDFFLDTSSIVKGKSKFQQKLVEYVFCYHADPANQCEMFFNSEIFCMGAGFIFKELSDELLTWDLKNYSYFFIENKKYHLNKINNFHKKLNYICKNYNDYCIISINRKVQCVVIDIGLHLICIFNTDEIVNLLEFLKIHEVDEKNTPKNIPNFFRYTVISNLLYRVIGINLKNNRNKIIFFAKNEPGVREYKYPILNANADAYEKRVDSYFFFEVQLRKDVPILDKDEKLMQELEDINRKIFLLVDEISGPILKLNESKDNPSSQFLTDCEVVVKSKEKYLKESLKCYGISSRECRNQLVLWAMECYFFYDSLGEKSSNVSYAAGWSFFEAVFRAVRAHFEKNCNQFEHLNFKLIDIFKIRFKKNSIEEYLISNLKKYNSSKKFLIRCYRVSSNFYVLRSSSPNGGVAIDVSLSIRQGLIDILNKFLAHYTNNEKSRYFVALSWSGVNPTRVENFLNFCCKNYKIFKIYFKQYEGRDINKLEVVKISD